MYLFLIDGSQSCSPRRPRCLNESAMWGTELSEHGDISYSLLGPLLSASLLVLQDASAFDSVFTIHIPIMSL